MRMTIATKARLAVLALALVSSAQARAAGDLLVAPTRVVLDGARGTEVILNNIGTEPATYRVSLELRRMPSSGPLAEVDPAEATEQEKAALAMISYAPRRVVLPPNQPQSIRIGIRAPEGLPDGEYRAHMLFRAIPEARPAVAATAAREGVSISLTPIYGVTIPVIVRQGSLAATAALSDPKLLAGEDGPEFHVTLNRNGDRSVYGRIRVSRTGLDRPILEARGIAVYTETGRRTVSLPLSAEAAAQMKGAVRIEYLEDQDAGGGVIASLDAVLR